ncbi:outer membrane beta-barrel protein [Lacimicrobium alkaliphilum]|nr:outer membrane beta-barrel protein [Lacimicrobium alkaliphilum]
MTNKVTSSICLATLMLGSMPVMAQEQSGYVIQTESGFDLIPGVDVTLKHDDNIANTQFNEQSSSILVVTPTLAATLLDGVNEYNLQTAVSGGRYFSSSIDDYFDAYASGQAKMEFTDQHRLQLDAEYLDSHDQRGTGVFDASGQTQPEPTEYRVIDLSGFYEFGARSTPARIRLGAGFMQKDYQNLKSITQFREFNKTSATAAFYYDTGAFTSLVAQFQRDDIRYDLVDIDRGSRDNLDARYMVGMDWQATALTSGELRIGYQDKTFDNPLREDFSGLSWEAAINWQPLSYSTVTLDTGRRARDPDLRGDVIKESSYGLGWEHDWSSDMQSNLLVGYVRSDYQGVDQLDKYWRYEANMSYRINYLWKLEGGVEFSDRSSNVDIFNFDKRVIYLSVGLNL